MPNWKNWGREPHVGYLLYNKEGYKNVFSCWFALYMMMYKKLIKKCLPLGDKGTGNRKIGEGVDVTPPNM